METKKTPENTKLCYETTENKNSLLGSKVQGHKVVNSPVTFKCLTQEICLLNINTGADEKLQAKKKAWFAHRCKDRQEGAQM